MFTVKTVYIYIWVQFEISFEKLLNYNVGCSAMFCADESPFDQTFFFNYMIQAFKNIFLKQSLSGSRQLLGCFEALGL